MLRVCPDCCARPAGISPVPVTYSWTCTPAMYFLPRPLSSFHFTQMRTRVLAGYPARPYVSWPLPLSPLRLLLATRQDSLQALCAGGSHPPGLLSFSLAYLLPSLERSSNCFFLPWSLCIVLKLAPSVLVCLLFPLPGILVHWLHSPPCPRFFMLQSPLNSEH